ncbi:leucyl/phenylalanyl-tRNA--protein transferase [Shimia aestuarii]|uniref:Leucyl/phenylalanyl-tRNA--protein transferase n=1 Tax=Shimia aestuarii TaxID=254406 RepID=A0A1I4QWQ2_9RHOB|nr:leucyl/phenylalanyl-tRNA--protein transferase [Shimia aestuarii]SFM44103.1 leucyl/phenylalanyl-tRNA--protein transferase [Shimia aestuarii]
MGELTPDLLMRAYGMGVFPMAEHRDDPEVFWVDPIRRGIIPLDRFHISRSLARAIRHADYTVTLNRDFSGVVDGCANRAETWINAEIRRLYMALHERGDAHSLEIWHNETLAGGVYGVTLGAAFFGESMFSRRPNASKIALAYLVEHLRRCGFTLFDTQFITDHLASLGALEIPRADYHKALTWATGQQADITAQSLPSAWDVLQRRTQTS